MRIGLDLMGGDTSPLVIFDAALNALACLSSSLQLVVIAYAPLIPELKSKASKELSKQQLERLSFVKALDVIEMKDEPLLAIKKKKKSSMHIGMRLLKKHDISAFISAGNTGALLASATLSIPKLPGITRPALIANLPTKKGSVAIIDVGGNLSAKPKHLLAYAHMGAAYQKCISAIQTPKIGLLNIGQESKKGTLLLRETYKLLEEVSLQSNANMTFTGNIEGRHVFQGDVDVVVTDGFSGNVLVKTSEGIAEVILEHLSSTLESYSSNESKGILNSVASLFHYAEYPGALLCGIDGIVIKCHGHSNAQAIFNGIKGAINMIENHFLEQIKSQL